MKPRDAIYGLVAGWLLVLGCSGGNDGPGVGGGGSGDGDGGGPTGTATVGGQGGGTGCAADCSAIMTAVCQEAHCNEETHQCELSQSLPGTACDDGMFCTVGEHCNLGFCIGGTPNDCGMAPSACGTVTCNEATKSCGSTPAFEGSPCAENDLCMVNFVCKNGQCAGVPKDCFFAPVPDACHVGVCNPATGICDPMIGNQGGPCPNDGDPCTVNKTCDGGVCGGGIPKDCSSFDNGCNLGVCEPVSGDCVLQPIPSGGTCAEATDECNTGICDDGGLCNPVPNPGVACASQTNECNDGFCDAGGLCQPTATPGVACPSATDQCNSGFCSVTGQCLPTAANEGGLCDDGNFCTTGEACTAGTCTGGMMGTLVTYFTETFAGNAAGWTLGPEWGIGPTMISSGEDAGFPDPTTDHTATADNGVAGVVIGGNAQTVLHAFYYLTSPPVDTNVAGPVYVEFWRWLNSDYQPFMTNTIDVWNGSAWINLFTSDFNGIEDFAWTPVSFDLTPYKNSALQVRFGFSIGDLGVFSVSSWNIDDFTIANQVCN